MNKLQGIIISIQKSDAIMLIDINVQGQNFSALLIESGPTPSWLYVGNLIFIVFKESEVSLAKDLKGEISMRNRMKCTVHSINRGKVLSIVTMKFISYTITSAITTRSIDALNISEGQDIEALIKSNELSLVGISR
jgi:molybdate transport system regulatory protein